MLERSRQEITIPRLFLRAVFICGIIPLFSGCYLARQGAYLIRYQVRSRPIVKVKKDTALSDSTKRFFDEVERIRRYAVDSIGLKPNKNYTRYVTIDSSYLMAMLSAADSASFETKKWCYPFFGCFPLRSYYKISDARRAGERLTRRGYEINIDKIDGFSTLGIFSDPLFSFMADYSVFTVAQFIFHEQTHATVYFGKDVQFSEELATFIGRTGALNYLETYYGSDSPEYLQARDYISDQETYLELLRKLYETLGTMYNLTITRDEKISRKKTIIQEFKRHLKEDYDSLFSTEWYRGVEKLTFNNAFLAVRMTYTLDLKLFNRFYAARGNSLREVILFATSCKKRRGSPKTLLEQEVAASD